MVREEKVRQVEELVKKFETYPVIGVFDLFQLPNKVLKEIRKVLKGKAEVKVVKKRIAFRAMEKHDKGLEKLIEKIDFPLGLIFSKENPFKLFNLVEEHKVQDFAKGGEIAEEDIILKAGITNLMAGPAISEFSKLRIPVGVEQGKIAIKKDYTLVKKGEVISPEAASILRKLNIAPLKIGLKIKYVYENGMIYDREALELVKTFKAELVKSYQAYLNFTLALDWPTPDNIKYLLIKAHQYARALEGRINV